MNQVIDHKSYSSSVSLQLIVAGAVFELSRIGPGYVVVREPIELPTSAAEVVMTVDGREHRWKVAMHGAVPFDERIDVEIIG